MLLALEAAKEGDTLEARGSLQRSLDARPEVVRFLHVPEGDVTSVAFGPEGKIAAGYGGAGVHGGGGVVLFDARGERLRPAPLEVKEGDVTSVAFGPEGQIAAGYGGGSSTSAAWCSSTPGASGSDPRRWRSRRAMSRAWPSGRRAESRDMRGVASAAWCSSTPGASGSDPRWWSRRAMSGAWPSGRRADRRGIWRPSRRRGALRRRSRLVAAEGGADGQPQLHAARVDAVLPRDLLPPHDPIPALAV